MVLKFPMLIKRSPCSNRFGTSRGKISESGVPVHKLYYKSVFASATFSIMEQILKQDTWRSVNGEHEN